MKICGNCGAQMPDEAVCCTNCGSPLQASQVPNQPYQQQDFQQQQQQYQYQQQPYQQPYQQPGSGKNTKAIVALILGLGGLLLTLAAPFLAGVPAVIGLVMCIVGIVFGVKARNELPEGHPDRGMATGGLTCAIIGTVISGIATCIVCVCACTICVGAGAGLSSADFSEYLDALTILFR